VLLRRPHKAVPAAAETAEPVEPGRTPPLLEPVGADELEGDGESKATPADPATRHTIEPD
jgi:hypothetical protein